MLQDTGSNSAGSTILSGSNSHFEAWLQLGEGLEGPSPLPGPPM